MKNKINILIVEDEAIVAADLEKCLNSLEYGVYPSISSGQVAIEKAEELRPDLVLMDIVLHGEIDGIQVADQIRSRFNIPVVYITAHSTREVVERAKKTEPFGYIIKPFNENELRVIIEMALYKHDIEKKLKESEEQYKRLVDGSPDIVWSFSDKRGTLYVSPRVEAILGYSPDFLYKNPWLWNQSIHPDDQNQVTRAILKFAAGKDIDVEYRIKNSSGDWRWFHDRSIGRNRGDRETIIEGISIDITERKRAEEELRLHSEIMTNMVEGVILIRVSNNTIVYANPKFEEMFGYGHGELIGKNISVINAPTEKSPEAVAKDIQSHLKKTGVWSGEVHNIRKDGTSFWCYANVSTFEHPEYEEVWVGIHTDITERKRAEEALRESEEKFRRLFEAAQDGILILDANTGQITDVNQYLKTILGYSKEEFVEKKLWEIGLFKDIAASKASFQKLRSKKYIRYEDLPLQRKNGKAIQVEFISNVYTAGNKKVVQCNIRNITEHKLAEVASKRAEEALQKSEEKYRTITENINAGIYRVFPGSKGRFIEANPNIVRMFGYGNKKEFLKLSLSNLYDNPKDWQKLNKKIQKNGYVKNEEFLLKSKNGKTFWGSVTAVAVRDEKGTMYYDGLIDDITVRKRAELRAMSYQKQLRSLTSELSLAEERERRRIAIELHDSIGQTLAVSKLKLSQLREFMSENESIRSFEEITELIDQTIQATRTLTFELSPTILYDLGFEAAVDWLTEKFQEQHGIVTKFKSDKQSKPLLSDVSSVLFKALRELLMNIVKHAQAKHVRVSIRRVGKTVRIKVQDDGIGFDDSKIDLHVSKTGEFGLFSIRERLDHLMGRVEIKSTPGRGTRITLVAPLKMEEDGEENKK